MKTRKKCCCGRLTVDSEFMNSIVVCMRKECLEQAKRMNEMELFRNKKNETRME